MIRILTADDHPIVREGLVAVLEDQPDFKVVASVGSAEEAMEQAAQTTPDVILLDLELPGLSGVEAIRALTQAIPKARIVIFSAYDAEELVLGAVKAGVGGYLLKGASAEEIARAVRVVHAGEAYLTARVAAKVMAEIGSPSRSGSLLSARERDVLPLLAEGLSNKQIARALAITERTVKFHVASIFRKLGAENRAQVVTVAHQRGLL